MNSTRERLRLLQRQAGRTALSSTDTARESIRAQLRRLLSRRTAVRRALEPPAGARLCEGLYLVEQREPAVPSPAIRLPWQDEVAAASERFVCFDTETTGLAGGVGTKAFMIGTGQWRDGA